MPIYKLSKNAVLETFEDGGLVLILPERRLVELNPSAVEIIRLLDGFRTPEQVADEIVKEHDIGHNILMTQIINDVLKLCEELNQSGVLELQPDLQESLNMTTAVATQFLRNPDVVLREEDPDEGALLFNPDTNQIRVMNHTGLFIWKMCDGTHSIADFTTALRETYEDVPDEQIDLQIKEFIDDMAANGFIGIQTSGGIENSSV